MLDHIRISSGAAVGCLALQTIKVRARCAFSHGCYCAKRRMVSDSSFQPRNNQNTRKGSGSSAACRHCLLSCISRISWLFSVLVAASARLAIFSVLSSQAAHGDWQEHQIRQGDGHGGWLVRPALRQLLRHPDSEFTMPFGLAQMDNGEIALLVSREKANPAGARITEPHIAFGKDGGASWSDFQAIPNTKGRPQFLQWLGGGRLSFITETFDGGQPQRIFSQDYGRTWNEAVDHSQTKDGRAFGVEGNGWIEFDDQGIVKAILEIGWHYAPGKSHPKDDATAVFRRSVDGGKTWIDETSPPQWKYVVEHNAKKWPRGVSEGSVLRAANGDLVAALRTDMPPKYFDGAHDDSLEGTAISISRDDGKTWSELQFLFDAGRHHANLQRLPNGDLVCTLIVRVDIQNGKLVTHGRGCDALISRDHGQTWNLDRRYELDRVDYLREDGYWVDGKVGHVGAVVLNDGHILSIYGNYPRGAALIKWKPDAEPAEADASPIRAGVGLFDHAQYETLGLHHLPGEHTLLYEATNDGYKYSHHPNLGVFQGRLYAMWSSGIEHEDDNGQRVLYCQSRDGVHWTEPAVLIDDPDGDGPLACVAAGFHATDDVLTAYYTTITRKHETFERDRLHAVTSGDGQKWSKPQPLGQGFFIESPRRLRSGRLLMNGQYDTSRPHLMFTDVADGHSGWQHAILPNTEGFSWPEPGWFQKADGSVVMLFRRQTTNAQATLYASTSHDDGKTWTRPTPTNFADATARFAAGNLQDGTAYIINNPSHTPDKNFKFIGRRNPLVISLSRDGVTFDRAYVIRGEATSMRFPGNNLKADGWQYPAAMIWQDHLYVVYSVNKEGSSGLSVLW